MLLSNRMRAVADLVKPCKCAADVGCDHGYIAIELVRGKVCERVIAMDINKGPLERASENIRLCGLSAQIETRLSNGLEALRAGEADCMVCAGMGGRLAASILTSGASKARQMKQLVLQPQSELFEFRRYLRENDFAIEREDMVFEDGKYYPMMSVVPAALAECIDVDEKRRRIYDMYGRYLLESSNSVLLQYLLRQREKLALIRRGLEEKGRAQGRRRMGEIDGEMDDIKFCLEEYF